jgi:hypothetical protein
MMLLDYETLIGQIEPTGFTCLVALAIKSPQPVDDLSSMLHLGERKVKEILERCFRFGYIGPVAPLDFSKWHITTKGRALLHAFFQIFLGDGSNPRQLILPGSNPATDGGSNPTGLNLGYVARGAQPPLIHSDQIIDQSFDQNHDFEMNEKPPAARDLQAVAAELDRHGIKDLPGKPNRSTLLADSWVTPERIAAAIQRAERNPLRKSPNPIGLAVAELKSHHAGIDEWIAQHAPVNEETQSEPDETPPPEPWPVIDDRYQENFQSLLGELSLEMTRATFITWVSPCRLYSVTDQHWTIITPNAYALEWLQSRLLQTVKRCLSAIVGQPVTVEFIVRQS